LFIDDQSIKGMMVLKVDSRRVSHPGSPLASLTNFYTMQKCGFAASTKEVYGYSESNRYKTYNKRTSTSSKYYIIMLQVGTGRRTSTADLGKHVIAQTQQENKGLSNL
jgi:hypothetical protein